MTTPAAYLRKSKDAVTKQDHLDALMASVREHGHNGDTVVYDDWARSGDRAKLAKRTGWKALCEAIERGEHDVVFMNDLDRGGRSIEEWARFMRVARDQGVRVIAAGTDWAAPERKLEFYLRAVFAEEELERAKARSATTTRLRERRGDTTTASQPPYGHRLARAGDVGMVTPERPDPRRVVLVPNPDEPLQPVLDAVRDAKRNIARAAKLLNARGVPSRSGRPWDPRSLGRIIDREAPRLRSRRVTIEGADGRTITRRVPAGRHPLSRLVRCHCSTWMTPNANRNEVICSLGHKVGKQTHGRWAARERHILAFLREHTADLRGRTGTRTYATDESAIRREELEAEKRRLGIALADDAIAESDYRERMERVKAELAGLAEADDEITVRVHQRGRLVKWELLESDREALGEQLREVVREVRVDEAMMPVGISLRV